jgi:hypothetical protein
MPSMQHSYIDFLFILNLDPVNWFVEETLIPWCSLIPWTDKTHSRTSGRRFLSSAILDVMFMRSLDPAPRGWNMWHPRRRLVHAPAS